MSLSVSLLLSLCMSLSALKSVALAACFTESPFASTCEPATSVASAGGIRGCFRPDLQPSGDSGRVSVVCDAATDSCVRRSTSCGSFAACSGRCLVSCDVAARGFLVLSLRAAVGVKSLALIDSPASSNGSVRGVSDVSQLPPVFSANVLDQLPSVVPLLTFKELLVSLFVANSSVVNVTFDLSQTPDALDRTNWFSQERLKTSWPVTDLKNRTFNVFSIQGDAQRRFYINYHYGGCASDSGLMTALDVSDGCPWAGSVPVPPRFVYSTTPDIPLQTKNDSADIMAIFIR